MKAIINAVKHERWCRVLTVLMRLTVGGVFIFSGFAKGVDPWGTTYKVTDYLNAMGATSWTNTALLIAVTLASIEFMLGIALAMGAYRRSAPWLGLIMMAIMLPVTLWIAFTGAVSDCGCFGDAMHLSAWATVGKNVLLTFGLIYLVLFNKSVRGVFGPAVQWLVMALSLGLVLAVAYFGYFTQPLIDYRPYPVGSRLVDTYTVESDDTEDGQDDEDEFVFVYSRDGQEREFSIDSLPDEEEGWEYVTRYHAKRPHGKVIMSSNYSSDDKLVIMDELGDDITTQLLGDSHRTLLLLFPDLPKVGVASSFTLNELTDAAMASDTEVLGLTPATPEEVAHWVDISMASYPIYSMDDSQLKTIARGNPAVVYLNDGVIVWKRTLTSLDGMTLPEHLEDVAGDYDPDAIMTRLQLAYLAGLLLLLVVNRLPLLIRFMRKSKKDSNL